MDTVSEPMCRKKEQKSGKIYELLSVVGGDIPSIFPGEDMSEPPAANETLTFSRCTDGVGVGHNGVELRKYTTSKPKNHKKTFSVDVQRR